VYEIDNTHWEIEAMRILGRSFAVLLLVAVVVHASSGRAGGTENMTPLLLDVQDPPVPFVGSDGRVHLVYELWMTNFSSGDVSVEKVDVLSGEDVLQSVNAATIASRLQASGQRESAGTLAGSTQGLLFLHVTLGAGAPIPAHLSHRVTVHARAAPPGRQEITEIGGEVTVDRQTVISIGPPLHGERYVSADSCCDAVRHTRAALPVNGRVWLAQRYAVDWEQLDAQGRIYAGPQEKLESYTIFGKPVVAVADAVVAAVVDGLPEQTPGKYPTNIPLEQADGNSVILDLGEQHYAMYAHMQPGTIQVRVGQKVGAGQLLGLVGNSGNSVAPHLHFQVINRPSSLAANGLPYAIKDFQITGKSPGTKAFDEAEERGTPLAVTPISPAQQVKGAMPLDQLIISFRTR
jgi:peptidase M23-like protein